MRWETFKFFGLGATYIRDLTIYCEFTKNIPYLALVDELLGVYWQYSLRKLSHNRTTLQYHTECWWCIYTSLARVIIGSGNSLAPCWHLAITWISDYISSIRPQWNELELKCKIFFFMKIHLKMLPAKYQPFCTGLSDIMWYADDPEYYHIQFGWMQLFNLWWGNYLKAVLWFTNPHVSISVG